MDGLFALLMPLSIFGGISLIISAATRARIERIQAERAMWQPAHMSAPQSDTILTELKALKQQVAEMQSTSHQFDISFDAALSRLEGRVDRLETRTATVVVPAGVADGPHALRNGNGQ